MSDSDDPLVTGIAMDTQTLGERAGSFDSVRSLIQWATGILSDAGIDSPRVDCELLLAHVLGIERGEVLRRALMGSRPFENAVQAQEFGALASRRAQRFPLQHLTGIAPFRHLELSVGPGVFVPRPETEIVAQVAIDELRAQIDRNHQVISMAHGEKPHEPNLGVVAVDLCTGSGAIALALATEVAEANVHAVELSKDAYTFTSRNNDAYGNLVHLVRGDARTSFPELNGTVDVVVSNPPYVPPGAIPKDREVAEHDPELALYGLGEDGLEVPRGVTNAAARLLKPGGLYVMEHAEVQDAQAREMVSLTSYFERVETRLDLTNRPRMVVAYRNNVAYMEGSLK